MKGEGEGQRERKRKRNKGKGRERERILAQAVLAKMISLHLNCLKVGRFSGFTLN